MTPPDILAFAGGGWTAWPGQIMAAIRGGGPWLFFGAMALLPAAPFPASAFSLTAASAFAGRLGLPGVVAASLAAVTVNLILTYWLARRALRPWIGRLLARFGYRLPEVPGGDATDLIILLRVVPGVPFFAQNYLLGLADAPFGRYLAISCASTWAYTVAFVLFGDGLLHGRARLALPGLGLIVAAAAAAHLARRRYAAKG